MGLDHLEWSVTGGSRLGVLTTILGGAPSRCPRICEWIKCYLEEQMKGIELLAL